MKRKLTALLPALLMGSMLLLVSCEKDSDDDGGGSSSATGSFSGDFTSGTTGEVSDWIASTATAIHNVDDETITFALVNANGDRIDVKVGNPEAGTNIFNNLSQNVTTYYKPTDGVMPTATSWSDDFADVSGGLLTIEQYDTAAMKINATCTLLWHTIVEGGSTEDADILYGLIQNGVLTDIPVTVVNDGILENDGTMAATIAGEAFSGTFVFADVTLGMNISGSDGIGKNISIILPKTAMSGVHDITDMSTSGYIVNYSEDFDSYVLETGTLDITSLNMVQGVAVGTFSGTFVPAFGGGDSIEITNGTFNVQ